MTTTLKDVTIVVPLMSCHSANTEFCDLIARTWVPVARASANLLDIIFLLSCRHLHTSHAATDQEYLFMRKGLHYKSRCLKTLRDAISIEAPNFTDSTIAQAIMLAYDELFTRDLKMLKHHTEGALQMVKLKGGPDTLGLDGLLKDMLSKLVAKGSGEVRLDTRIVQGWTLGDHDW
ncbi:C6 finger domain protein [Penicillium diatomitis]|uniref:C6 finger domain protein n=1 Tax=Penicillium diatomitis TaxID=2819901 RepID=A0A9W9X564_9EURO|nr:C6 finger domain protein [Penicillium diatomitis]KAJ5484083.1 C6 finger domain protein [Penicillium diatomitis]